MRSQTHHRSKVLSVSRQACCISRTVTAGSAMERVRARVTALPCIAMMLI